MFSRFSRRGLCLFLALITLCVCLSPALAQPADAVGIGAILGTTAIAATAVAGATLISLGLSPKADTTAWDNAVSGLVDHFNSLGYVVDGMIQVAKFKPTDDAEDLKAAIAMDYVNFAAQWVSDEGIVSTNSLIPTATSSTTFQFMGNDFIFSTSDVYLLAWEYPSNVVMDDYFGPGYYSAWLICSPFPFTATSNGYRLDVKKYGNNYGYFPGGAHPTKTSCGYPYWYNPSASDLSTFISGLSFDDFSLSGIDVSSVPANFTDIPTAYPDWVASGADYAGTTYLPINIYIPGSGAEVLPTEVPDVTDATDPSENPDKDPDDPSEGDWLWPGLEIMFTELKENANQVGSAIQEKIDSSLERLGDRVQQLQDGILPQIEAFKDTVTQGFVDCQNWFQSLGDSIASALDSLGTKLSTGIQSIFDTLREFATQTFPAKMAEVGQWIQSLPDKIAEAIKKILPQHEDLGTAHPADWKSIFPFCVPFDLIEFLGVLNAEPEAPVIHWRFYVPRIVDYDIVIDLSVFDGVAQIMRTMELLAFCVGLILLTRNIIRG